MGGDGVGPFDAGFLAAAGACGLFYLWFLSSSLPLTDRIGARQHYYTAAALALLHGRLDVPVQNLGFECFMVHDRCYGYFGLAPTLLRLPLVLLLGARAQSDSFERVFLVLGFLTAAAGVWWISRQLMALWAPAARRRRLVVAGALAAACSLGASPMIFLVSRPLVYEEAILWGVAFACVALGAAIALRFRPRPALVGVLLAADTMGVLSRPTVGASALAATVGLGAWFLLEAWRRRSRPGSATAPLRGLGRPGGLGACLVAGALLAGVSASLVAYAKFGSIAPPYADQVLIRDNPSRVAEFSHFAGLNLAVLPTRLLSNLRPDSLSLTAHPPYVAFGEVTPTLVGPIQISDVTWEPTSSVTATMPGSSLLAMAGLICLGAAVWRWRTSRHPDPRLGVSALAVASAGAALVVGLMFPGQIFRYLADWLPLLVLLSAIGLARLVSAGSRPGWRTGVAVTTLALAIGFQAVAQTAVAVGNGLTSYQLSASCVWPGNHYGLLGEAFCPNG